ncbi:MAG: sugar phosphate isomerase/epimerase [Acidobacteria bacterium]|nr:sugar phosphate isomerase/epimerase [Acidobacteriota bacterium]
MNRRTFLASAATPLLLQAKKQKSPTLQAGPYVWTQHFGRLGQKPQEHIPDICAGFAGAGYKDVELMSMFLTPELEDITVKALKDNKLQCSVVYNGGPLHTPDAARATIDSTVALAQRLQRRFALKAITINPNPIGRAKTDDELKVQAGALNQLGQKLNALGLGQYLHQHAPEMADNAREWRAMLAQTDPKNLGVCLDVHWILRGKQDVMTLTKEAGPRLGSLHLRNSVNGVWSEDFGDGDIDYRQVAAYLKSIKYSGYLSVELAYDKETKITRSLEESLKLSRLYTEKVFGVKA